MSHPTDERPVDFVQSLDRGLSVIRAFSRERGQLTLSDVARKTGLTRAAARRFLITLETLGYVGSDGRQFFLRPKVLELGYAYLSSLSVAEFAQDHLAELAEELHESASASVLDGQDIVYVARAATNRIMTISLTVGARLPAVSTSMGRVLLAALNDKDLDIFLKSVEIYPATSKTITDHKAVKASIQRVRRDGWAVIDQELEVGVRSVSVPVRDAAGNVVLAINVSAHASRVPVDVLRNSFLPKLQLCAAAIETDLRSRG